MDAVTSPKTPEELLLYLKTQWGFAEKQSISSIGEYTPNAKGPGGFFKWLRHGTSGDLFRFDDPQLRPPGAYSFRTVDVDGVELQKGDYYRFNVTTGKKPSPEKPYDLRVDGAIKILKTAALRERFEQERAERLGRAINVLNLDFSNQSSTSALKKKW